MVVGSVDRARALVQHLALVGAVRGMGVWVCTLPFVHGAFDSVFAKDNALYTERHGVIYALLAQLRYPERQAEQVVRRSDLLRHGHAIVEHTAEFEGGDVLLVPGRCAFLGHGVRSSRDAASDIERFLGLPVVPLELVDPALFHLDTALTVLSDGIALACDEALSPAARRALRRRCAVIRVSREAALQFALNVVEIGDAIVTGTNSAEVNDILNSLGKRVVYTPLDQFHRAGGSTACLLAPVHDHGTVAVAATTAIRSTAA